MITRRYRLAVTALAGGGALTALLGAPIAAADDPQDADPAPPPIVVVVEPGPADPVAPAAVPAALPEGVPHLPSPQNPPPGTSQTPPPHRTLGYLRDLWHAVRTQDVDMSDALLLLTQRPMSSPPPAGMSPRPQQPAPLPETSPEPSPQPSPVPELPAP